VSCRRLTSGLFSGANIQRVGWGFSLQVTLWGSCHREGSRTGGLESMKEFTQAKIINLANKVSA
jgi:hypothetical protein